MQSFIKKNGSVTKSFSTHKAANNKIKGAYLVRINNEVVF